MKLKRCEIKTYVTLEDYHDIAQESVARRTSIANVMRNCIKEYFLLRDELASALEVPGSLGHNHSGKIIHTLLMRTEERFQLALDQLEKRIRHMEAQINQLTAMIDRFHWEVMYYSPLVAESFHDTATVRSKSAAS